MAGGRYDGLIDSDPSTPGVGWAAGIECIAMMIEAPGSGTASIPDPNRRGRLDCGTQTRARLAQSGTLLKWAIQAISTYETGDRPNASPRIIGETELERAQRRSGIWTQITSRNRAGQSGYLGLSPEGLGGLFRFPLFQDLHRFAIVASMQNLPDAIREQLFVAVGIAGIACSGVWRRGSYAALYLRPGRGCVSFPNQKRRVAL